MVLLNFGKLQSRNVIPLSDDYAAINFLTSKAVNGYINASEALMNSDIYSVIFQLSMDLADCIIKAKKKSVQTLLNNPAVTANVHGFWQGMFAQLLLDGNAYAYRWRNKNGKDKYLEYLRPSQVEPMLLDDGSGLVYNLDFDEPEIGFMQNVPQSDVIHFRLLSNNGGKTGVSPLLALTNEATIQKESNRLTLNALEHAIMSPGVLKIQKGGLLNDKQKAARSRAFANQINNSNGGPVVIDDLEDYQPLEIKADVAKLLAQVDWTTTQIAKVYGMPDSYLNGQGDQQSSLQMIQGFYANSLNRYAQVIASELSNKFSTTVKVNIRPATDPNGDTFATVLGGMAKDKILDNQQVTTMLEAVDYFPVKLPPAKQVTTEPAEGGEDNAKDTN